MILDTHCTRDMRMLRIQAYQIMIPLLKYKPTQLCETDDELEIVFPQNPNSGSSTA